MASCYDKIFADIYESYIDSYIQPLVGHPVLFDEEEAILIHQTSQKHCSVFYNNNIYILKSNIQCIQRYE